MYYIGINLATPPLREVFARDSDYSCPDDFEETTFGNFPGTLPGCYCENNE